MASDSRPCEPLNVNKETQVFVTLECAVSRGSCAVQSLLICRTL